MLDLIVSESAKRDLIEIGNYIAHNNPYQASRFIEKIKQKFPLLASRPKMGRVRNEVLLGLRSIPFGRYVIFYRIQEKYLEIDRVLHSARDIKRIMTPS
jgi:toxin ParE1/3/4